MTLRARRRWAVSAAVALGLVVAAVVLVALPRSERLVMRLGADGVTTNNLAVLEVLSDSKDSAPAG